MQTYWDVSAAHAHVVERTSALSWHEVPARPERKQKRFFEKIRTRFISLFWL
jgi:hypothetical protein